MPPRKKKRNHNAGGSYHAIMSIGKLLQSTLEDPHRKPGKVRTLADMSEEEITALERGLGAKVTGRC